MRILFAGNFKPEYNRNSILIEGLKKRNDVSITLMPNSNRAAIRKEIKGYDLVYLPAFTHGDVRKIKRIANCPVVFDPLISKYLTKVFDRKKVSRYSVRAYKNYLKDKWAMQAADFVIADTNAHKAYYQSKFHLNPSKIGVLPIGSPQSFIENHALRSQNDDFIVGFTGSFIPLHGLDKIVQAAALLKHIPDIRFELVGAGSTLRSSKQKVEELNLHNVSFIPWLDFNGLMQKIAEFDICLGIFGDSEKADLVIPNKIFHYAGSGKCIISKDSTAIREVFSHQQDILLSENNAESLAGWIEKVYRDQKMIDKIGSSAQKLIKDQYTDVQIAQRFMDLVLPLLK